MDAQVHLAPEWRQALKRGQAVVAEISVDEGAASPQQLAEAALKLRKQGAFFFLETQGGTDASGRFSLIAGEPLFSFLARGRRGVWHAAGQTLDLNEAPEQSFESIGRAFKACGVHEAAPGLSPLLGWLSYEAGARYERLPLPKPEPMGMPDWLLMLPGQWAWLDSGRRQWRFRLMLAGRAFYARMHSALGLPAAPGPQAPWQDPEKSIEAWREALRTLLERAQAIAPDPPAAQARPLDISGNFGKDEFCAAVARAREYIGAGDIFQVNLSHRQSAPYHGGAWRLFRRLSQVNPSPFACFAELGSYQIVSASPERLFLQDASRVETRPIAGTMARGQDASELRLSEKDRAEHVMTVDIERSDLSRVCIPGSVQVSELMALETYSHLHHLVSRVQGTLRDRCELPDLFRAGFPGGSITGAPKIRCMEIIAELEGQRRGLYTGSLGYWDPLRRRADFNILIRTIFLAQGRAQWQVGAGIVADSDPEREWEETLHKAAALKLALETAPL